MKVTIIIRAYNAQDTIERAVQSALDQNMPKKNYEIVIVNDGSQDNTSEIIERLASKKQIRVFHQKNQGGTAAANNGIKKSEGEYVILLDDDDHLLPSCIKELSSYLDAHPDTDFAYPDYYEQVGKKRTRASPKHLFESLDGGTMFRKKRLVEEGGYSLHIIFAGYDLLLRTMEIWKGGHVKKPLFVYTRNGESNTANTAFVKKGIEQLKTRFPEKLDIINTIRSYETN